MYEFDILKHLMGRKFKVSSGEYKGLNGRLLGILTPNTYRVELENKKITDLPESVLEFFNGEMKYDLMEEKS